MPPVPFLGGIDAEAGLLSEGGLGCEPPPGPVRVIGAGAGEDPPLVGLEEMVVVAKEGQIVELGGATLGEGDQVVDLEAEGDPAAGHHTGGVPVDQGGA